jgi:diaminopimelate epimerase
VKTVAGEESPMVVEPSVPHLVLLVKDVDAVPVAERGPLLRRDAALGEGGANVNWVSPKGEGSWRMRTFERGVEGETLACGTGAVATALVLAAQKLAKSPVRLWTRSGLPLLVTWDPGPKTATALRLRGEGRVVYRGILGELLSQAQATD